MSKTQTKYYYELQWPVSAVWTPKNCAHMTENKLIKDASFRLSDYLIEDAKASGDTKLVEKYRHDYSLLNSNSDFDSVKFPILQQIYADDDQALSRFTSQDELDPEQDIDF